MHTFYSRNGLLKLLDLAYEAGSGMGPVPERRKFDLLFEVENALDGTIDPLSQLGIGPGCGRYEIKRFFEQRRRLRKQNHVVSRLDSLQESLRRESGRCHCTHGQVVRYNDTLETHSLTEKPVHNSVG